MTDPPETSRRTHVFAEPPVIPTRSTDPEVAARRLVVGLVVAVVITLGAIIAAIGFLFAGSTVVVDPTWVDFLGANLLVSNELPPSTLFLVALVSLVIVAGTALALETIAALLSVNPRRAVLNEYRQTQTDTSAGATVRLTVLVPAHDEETSLPITLAALKDQTRPPDRVIVVADNCTDGTVRVAQEMGVEVVESVNNTDKKAGALNQVLNQILPRCDASDVVMIMDADTSLTPRFLEVGATRLTTDPELMAVGGVFYGEGGSGLVGQFQRNEYARYSLQIRSRRERVFVLTGTATMFRASALLDVAAARGVFIPGETGRVYDTAALTEDNELTLALKSLGAPMVSPSECKVTTEIMPTWHNLWVQRKRWQRGALENLSAYGLTRGTFRYWGQQFGIA
nr:glycosyltransferase family 2 protein [Actinomycetes bacterium]